MEDEDEFGDLYTDVLRQFHHSSVLQPSTEQPKHPSPKRPIDLSVQSKDEEILLGASDPNPPIDFTGSHHTQNLVLKYTNSTPEHGLAKSSESPRDLNHEMVKDAGVIKRASDLQDPIVNRVLESGCNEKLQQRLPKSMDECRVDFLVEERSDEDICLAEKDQGLIDKEENFEKFDIEEAEEPVIPGVSDAADHRGEGNDWDSDSEDDLNIVLNETNHGPTVMAGLVGSGHEGYEDGAPLVLVADSEPGHLPMEEREIWGEDSAQAADGERKELGEAAKVNEVAVGAPKIVYNSNFSYQPYHSQFKYVRPGGAPIPGAPGQIRPPVNMGPVGGFGRGDWRPTGIRNTFPMQKNSHPGFGMNGGWGNGTAGRGFGSGLDFTLPSHKTVFEVDVDSFEEKPWRLPGLDMSDFFNFGLNEESWKVYCKQLEQLRVEMTMQSKIRVYESGRSQQEYDPDLPPELAAAGAAHIRDISSENANTWNLDGGQIGVSNGLTDVRTPVTIGRAIQVETSYVERLPSTDTRPLRIRDSDVIIEIVLQGSTDDTSLPVNDVTEQPENQPLMENFKGGQEINGDVAGEALLPYRLNSSEQYSTCPGRDGDTLHEERQTKERACNRSPIMTRSCSTLDKEIQNEDSVESISGKHSIQLSYPVTIGSAEKPDIEHGDALHGSPGMSDREEMALDRTTLTDVHIGGNLLPSVKKQKLSSRIEHSPDQEIADRGNLKAEKSRENSIARSDSSRDYHKLRNSTDEEVVQHGRSSRMRNIKRPYVEDEQSDRIKSHNERREAEKHYMAEKGWENSHSHQYLDPRSTRHLHMKTEGIDRRKEGENSEGAWQRRDDDPRGRRIRVEETRNKVREREKMDKDEHFQLRKQLDNCNSRVYHDKDVGSRSRERDDNSKNRYESMNDHYSKRWKEEDYLRRDVEKEELLHNHKESLAGRKRERNDALDMRKRDDQVRTREDIHSSVRHKEDGWIHREREQMHKSKQSHEESLSKREREEQREGLRKRDRDTEEKTWIPNSRIKDEYEDTFDRDYKEDGWIHRERDQMHKSKQSHEESLSKREREEQREGVRKRDRDAEEKTWIPNSRIKGEFKDTFDRDYKFKNTGRHNEQLKRRVEDGSLSQHRGREDLHSTRGSQLNKDERRSRQERESTRRELVDGGSVNNRGHEKNRKENTRSKDSEGEDHNSGGTSTRNQEDQNGHVNEPAILKGTTEKEKHNQDFSDDEKQRDSRRGRSKLERWTGHKERDFNIDSKSSTKVKEFDEYKNGAEESSKAVETIGDGRDLKEEKSVDGRHLDTVDKLKQRRERFKLPMPIDKEVTGVKKMEVESLPCSQSEDSEIKPERPPRKRRWISN